MTGFSAFPPCSGPTANADVKVTYTFSFITPIGAIAKLFGGAGLGSTLALKAEGVMPCET